jgi:hypothetical protein
MHLGRSAKTLTFDWRPSPGKSARLARKLDLAILRGLVVLVRVELVLCGAFKAILGLAGTRSSYTSQDNTVPYSLR